MFLSHIICISFDCLSFHIHVNPLFLHSRERKAELPLLSSSQFSVQRESQPLQTSLMHSMILPFSPSRFFSNGG